LTKNVLAICNPKAGRIKLRDRLKAARRQLGAGFLWTEVITESPQHARQIAREKGEKADLILAIGGDGTISEIVNGMMMLSKRPPLTIIATGTTNDFAKALGWTRSKKTRWKTLQKEGFDIDIGDANGRKFVYCACFGFLCSVAYKTPQYLKKMFGRMAYYFWGIPGFFDFRHYEVELEADGEKSKEDIAFFALTNSYRLAGLFHYKSEQVVLDDGQFEVMIVRYPGSFIKLRMLLVSLSKRIEESRFVRLLRCKRLVLSSKVPLPLCLDGEDGGLHKEITITNLTRAIRIVRP